MTPVRIRFDGFFGSPGLDGKMPRFTLLSRDGTELERVDVICGGTALAMLSGGNFEEWDEDRKAISAGVVTVASWRQDEDIEDFHRDPLSKVSFDSVQNPHELDPVSGDNIEALENHEPVSISNISPRLRTDPGFIERTRDSDDSDD